MTSMGMSNMWTSAKCNACGWMAKSMLTAKIQGRKCPYCGEEELRPR